MLSRVGPSPRLPPWRSARRPRAGPANGAPRPCPTRAGSPGVRWCAQRVEPVAGAVLPSARGLLPRPRRPGADQPRPGRPAQARRARSAAARHHAGDQPRPAERTWARSDGLNRLAPSGPPLCACFRSRFMGFISWDEQSPHSSGAVQLRSAAVTLRREARTWPHLPQASDPPQAPAVGGEDHADVSDPVERMAPQPAVLLHAAAQRPPCDHLHPESHLTASPE